LKQVLGDCDEEISEEMGLTNHFSPRKDIFLMRLKLMDPIRLALLLGLSWVLPAGAEPVINEFLASNQSIAPDNCDFDDYSDWIELYNPAATNVSLENYYLTDDLDQPYKWAIPDGTTIPAGGYLMFRADGYDVGPGETYLRGYYPWTSTFETRRYHTNFKLSADGEELGIYRTDTPAEESTVIATNAVWKYLDTGGDPGTNWMSVSYADDSWSEGAAELGYGDGDEATEVDYGSNSSSKYPTTYFRHHFTVTDPDIVGDISFQVLIDDGAVIYLNGEEVTRLRIDDGDVTYLDYANETASEGVYETVELSASQFVAGDNVLAVEVHQVSATSSDISFNAELVLSEITGTPVLVDSITFDAQTTDVSYGRNATNGWSYFGEPTPEGTNDTEALTFFTSAPDVTASLDSGYYSGEKTVALSTSEASDSIHYTLDGSVPSSSSLLYTNELTISDTTILRARSFSAGEIPGGILTRSYLMSDDVSSTLPFYSLVADPEALFGDDIGICENDTDYPFKGREVPVRLELFETNQTAAFAVSAGIRISGENIWEKAQKPFNVYCRSKYGDDFINYQIFPDENVATFGELCLRNGGDDWEETLLRDALMPSILVDQTDVCLYSYRPSILFLNGEFWGIYNMRKRFDAYYFANEHYLAEDEYDLCAYAHNTDGDTVLSAELGSTDAYETFYSYFTTNDCSDPLVYAEIENQMNIDSFIDYVAATDYAVNTSWSHNREFWKGYADGSKWTWIANDFDRALSSSSVSGSIIDDFLTDYELFKALADNTNFVNRLVQRYAAHLGSTFYPDRVSNQLDLLSAEQDGEMERHIERWADDGGIASLTSRQSELDEIKQFAEDRPAYALSRLETELDLNLSMADLTVTCSPSDGGTVAVAGVPIIPEYNTAISLFLETPVELTAESLPGYTFTGWSTGDTNQTIEITMTAAQSISASFEASDETLLASTLSVDTTLTAANSPYTLDGDLTVEADVTLTVEAGVEFRMPAKSSIIVYGALQINGTESNPVSIAARGASAWGNLSFVDATGSSTLSYLTLRDASRSYQDPKNLKAAVSAYNSTLILDGADVETELPIFTQYGSTTLQNCQISILFSGDGINIKYGSGSVSDSTFVGNDCVDTDAVDFDDVENGLISGNRIYAFLGDNSDALDIGEGCVDLLVISNRIFNCTDKGISVGQASTVTIQRNLIVDCDMGVGIKDTGSTAYIDQNTFALNNVGVSVFEKNAGSGGGIAYITNSIFYDSDEASIYVDDLSTLTVNYSLSDTDVLSGTGNLFADPLFTDAGSYDFSLTADSPAIDSGDPEHALDADGSAADMGACYVYDADDYPYLVVNIVVINEVLAHSHETAADWIELFNNSSSDLDIGGWYLSDDSDVPEKYRIADGTILSGNGYLVFYEDIDFGYSSTHSGALIPFALSENGDTVNLYGPTDGLRPDYNESETFGASLRSVTLGRYYKESTRTYNFVAMAYATPGAANSDPSVGPVVISEIMYHPVTADAEYIELVNISSNTASLYDTDVSAPWKMTEGIELTFSSNSPVSLASGERMVLVRDADTFAMEYSIPEDIQVIQWDSGALDNGGEIVEISQPGDTNSVGELQYIRVDRVSYSDEDPWPTGPDGSGTALVRIDESSYGNDVTNWTESSASPGQSAYEKWASDSGLVDGEDEPADNPDGDAYNNQIEYALGLDPTVVSDSSDWQMEMSDSAVAVTFSISTDRPNVNYSIESTDDLLTGDWTTLSGTVSSSLIRAQDSGLSTQRFYRLWIELLNQY
jgi:uncharacterized repeat protein (TIGR02543 family)